MRNIYYAFIFLCLNLALVKGQTERIKKIGVEAGSDFYHYEYHQLDFIRENNPTQYSENVPGSFQKIYTGLKAEIRSTNNRFGFFSGLRYTRIYSSLGKGEVFYLQTNINENTLELLRVSEISQSAHYLGVPIEARYFVFKPKRIGLFFKTSIEFNYLLNSNTDITFQNNSMNSYNDEIEKKFQDPKSFYSAMFVGFGIKIGKDDKPNLNVEACLPTFYLSEYSTGIVKPDLGGGIQINFQIPF